MLPYPWCHLNYRHENPCQSLLCALPVESTAAITSGARLPLLPPGGFRGKLTGVRSGFALCAALTCPRSLQKNIETLLFPVNAFSCKHCITAFCPCQHSRGIFLRFARQSRTVPPILRFGHSDGTARTGRCPHTAGQSRALPSGGPALRP